MQTTNTRTTLIPTLDFVMVSSTHPQRVLLVLGLLAPGAQGNLFTVGNVQGAPAATQAGRHARAPERGVKLRDQGDRQAVWEYKNQVRRNVAGGARPGVERRGQRSATWRALHVNEIMEHGSIN